MSSHPVAGLVLAGGKGVRLGASVPKPLVPLGGRPLLVHVLRRFPAEIEPVLINANDRQAFAGYGSNVVSDRLPDFPGPLAGLDAGAAWLKENQPRAVGLVGLPGDTPFLPHDIVTRLALGPADRLRLASFAGRVQPTVGYWPLFVLADLQRHLLASENRSVIGFAERWGFEAVAFEPDAGAPGEDPFFNVNTPADLDIARTWLSR